MYVLVYGLNPLRIYIHDQGLARFATEPYQRPKPANLSNIYVHLTNYAINKNNLKFEQNNLKRRHCSDSESEYDEESEDYYDEEETGHKRSLLAVMKLIHGDGGDPDKVMDEIKDLVIKTVMVGQPSMDYTYKVCQPECIDNSMCF